MDQTNALQLIQGGNRYASSLYAYQRRSTIPVQIGDVMMGSDFPIRIQSMTTVDTMDTEGSIEQSIRMIEAGCELVRITAPSVKEAQNLALIRQGLRARGYHTPLVADIHFTPNAAELAARIVEKVRINPGNYADKKRFETISYSDASYASELERIRDKFLPLVKICKEYGTAMRIGTNHGSLSDRILSRYGDTPLGMVESALEFIRICEDEGYYNLVISMKASNTQVMVEAYRLLVKRLDSDQFKPYPLHLGVTEAGEGEDGRIKSAVGIGTLLEDGLGDTVRVSLTEDPEFEIPVARALVDRYQHRAAQAGFIPAMQGLEPGFDSPIHPFFHQRRNSLEIGNFGGHQVPRVLADFSSLSSIQIEDLKSIGHFYLPEPDKWAMNDLGADYLYTGGQTPDFMLPNGLKLVLDAQTWLEKPASLRAHPLFDLPAFEQISKRDAELNFLRISAPDLIQDAARWNFLNQEKVVLLLYSHNAHQMAELRRAFFALIQAGVQVPMVLHLNYPNASKDELSLFTATDAGGLLVDGLGDGLMLSVEARNEGLAFANATAFGTLQAARARISKTEYISCPSCGRTLFDLQETTAKIRKVTDHLKGIKIGIMGCIVNGPGEMADADYGYVGIGKDKIALYRGQEVVKKSVHADQAVDELINLIKEDGNWRAPVETNTSHG